MWNKESTFALLKGLPFVLVGIFLCATIFLAPIGLGLILYSGAPLARAQLKHVKQQTEDEFRKKEVF